MRTRPALRFGLLVSAGAAIVAAQSPPPSQQTFRAGVDLVQVDVSVLDKNRRPVRGLRSADFTLLEDGKKRAIVAFTAVDLPERADPVLAPWTRDIAPGVATNTLPQEGRLVVILMDRTIPYGFATANARAIAGAAVRELGAGDLAAVVYTGGGTPQDFTNDRARLLASIHGAYPGAELSAGADEKWDAMVDELYAELSRDTGNPLALSALAFSAECPCGACVLDAITRIASAVRDVARRRKSLLFIGRNLQVETVESACIDAVHTARDAMFRALDLASLTVHSLDPGGLETLGLEAASNVQGQSAMRAIGAKSRANLVQQGNLAVLPDRTGGRTVINTNSPAARVPEIFIESGSYYLLGFEPAVADGLRHEIAVRVNRRGADVRTRRGYLASPPAAAASESVDAGAAARSAIGGVMPTRDGVSLSASALALAAPSTGAPVLAIALHVRHEASAAVPALTSGAELVDVVTGIFTMTGQPVGTLRQTLNVTPQAGASGTVIYDVLQRIPARPGRYELRIGLHNAARRQTGSVYTFIDIPDYGKTTFAASDVAVFAPLGTPAMTDSLADVLLAPATARRDFDRREHATAFVRFYQRRDGLLESVALSTRILDESNRRRYGQETSIAASDFSTTRTADYAVDLPLGDLEPGAYLLTIEAKAGRSSARRDVRFTVR